MRIAVDAHMLGEQEGGNETYVAGLLQGFTRATLPEDVIITALYNRSYVLPQPQGRIQCRAFQRNGNFHRLFVELGMVCRQVRADILHVTYNAPLFVPCTLVVSVHDIIFRRYPQFFSPRVRILLSTLMPLSMRRANVIVTLSEASREDIHRYYPFTRDKVVVTPLAPGPVATVAPQTEAAQRITGGQDFILAVGTVQPRKNIARLIRAYVDARRRRATTARLVVVGRAAWQHSEVHRIAAESPYYQDIIFTGYLDDATVAALYRSCAVFVYPSLYEGFGLPVIEAMACGAPVITSNLSSLPEVAGDAALLVNPFDVGQISTAIERMLNDHSLREDLRERGVRQAARFSWERTAMETFEAYQWALQKKSVS